MASVKFEKDSLEWCMFQDYWKLCQELWVPEDRDEYWSWVVKRVSEFMEKYENMDLAKKIALGLLDTLEEKERNLQNEIRTDH